MGVAESMRGKLVNQFRPVRLDIVDESHRHQGHAGARPGGESHFRIEVVSRAFADKNRVARQRMVYELLAAELKGGVHALSLATLTPEEDAAQRQA